MHLLQHFKELTVHPKNAEELKGLILQLAIQGKLTKKWREQNDISISIDELVNSLNIEEEELKKCASEVKDLTIPRNWFKSKFQYVFDMKGGSQPPKSKFITEPSDGYVQLYQIRDFGKKPQPVYVPKESVSKFCTEKDIMIGRYGASIGKVFYGKNGAYNVALVKLIWEESLLLQDFVYFLFSSFYIQEFFQNCSRSAQAGFNKADMGELSIPIPPIEEQKAIVAIVNQLFKEVEALETETKTRVSLKEDFVSSALHQLTTSNDTATEWAFLQQHFKTFFTEKNAVKKLRESILQLAVQGKLTAKWRAKNPELITGKNSASELLKKIKAEKEQLVKEKKIKKEKPLPEVTEDEIPYELPEGWIWCRLEEFTTIKGGKRLPKGEKLTTENTGLIYIRVTDMKNGTIDDSDLHYISPDIHAKISQYTITKDDIYLTIVGATIGKLGLVPSKFDGMNLTENAARIIKYQVNKDFLFRLMSSKFIQGQFFDKTNQVGVPKLALHRVAKTLIPLPPLEEQNAVVSVVNILMALCDDLEQEIENNTTHIEQLMQSCLKEVYA